MFHKECRVYSIWEHGASGRFPCTHSRTPHRIDASRSHDPLVKTRRVGNCCRKAWNGEDGLGDADSRYRSFYGEGSICSLSGNDKRGIGTSTVGYKGKSGLNQDEDGTSVRGLLAEADKCCWCDCGAEDDNQRLR